MKYLRPIFAPLSFQLASRRVLAAFFQAHLAIVLIFLLVPLALADDQKRGWSGDWLVVGEGDEQLVWQLNSDGSGYAYGFLPSGHLSHGFAINWSVQGNRVRIRTGASVRCNGGVVAVAFTGWSPVTLNFAILDGRHWRQHGGGLLAFQRRLDSWETPRAGAECPRLSG